MAPAADQAISPPKDEIASIHARIKMFEHPFAHHVMNPRAAEFCSWCMRGADPGSKLLKCAACDFAHYCNKECQRLAWKVHRPECRRLKESFPNLPLTEVLFLSKIIDRVVFLAQNGDKFGWEKDRTFKSLMGHNEEISKDEVKMSHFEKVVVKMTAFRKDEMISRDAFFDIFCKATINSHSIHTSAGVEVGMSLDLGVSKYNHSCRPTCSMVFDGFRVCLRPLVPGIDAADTTQAFISYIDVGRSKYVRRKDLKARWYFDCECTRCSDPGDDVLTAIKCSNKDCDAQLITSEVAEPCHIACSKCKTISDDVYVKECQDLMKELPANFDPKCPAELLQELLDKAEKKLHPSNVYIARLRTAMFRDTIWSVTGQLNMTNLSHMHKQIYENYKQCFPKADRHVGYQLIYIVKALIEKGERDEAMPYAFDAMNIFEVCFGLDHPFYLQTLALWTFLEKKIEKTDAELLSLINFGDNKPVDIVSLLERANMLPPTPETAN